MPWTGDTGNNITGFTNPSTPAKSGMIKKWYSDVFGGQFGSPSQKQHLSRGGDIWSEVEIDRPLYMCPYYLNFCNMQGFKKLKPS